MTKRVGIDHDFSGIELAVAELRETPPTKEIQDVLWRPRECGSNWLTCRRYTSRRDRRWASRRRRRKTSRTQFGKSLLRADRRDSEGERLLLAPRRYPRAGNRSWPGAAQCDRRNCRSESRRSAKVERDRCAKTSCTHSTTSPSAPRRQRKEVNSLLMRLQFSRLLGLTCGLPDAGQRATAIARTRFLLRRRRCGLCRPGRCLRRRNIGCVQQLAQVGRRHRPAQQNIPALRRCCPRRRAIRAAPAVSTPSTTTRSPSCALSRVMPRSSVTRRSSSPRPCRNDWSILTL